VISYTLIEKQDENNFLNLSSTLPPQASVQHPSRALFTSIPRSKNTSLSSVSFDMIALVHWFVSKDNQMNRIRTTS